MIDLLINRARSFIYSTAPPPFLAYAACEVLGLVADRDGDERRARLSANVAQLRRALEEGGMSAPATPAAILPVILGAEEVALAASARLREHGFLVPAIRFPTVARGSARLRITLGAENKAEEIVALASSNRVRLLSFEKARKLPESWHAPCFS